MTARRGKWDGPRVRALRRHLGLTQERLAGRLGIRQQTVSEWETGMYQPRGSSETLLSMVAEDSGFPYESQRGGATGNPGESGAYGE